MEPQELIHTKLNVSLMALGVMLLALIGFGVFMAHYMQSYGEALGHMNASFEQLSKENKDLKDRLATDEALIGDLTKQQAQQQSEINARDKKATTEKAKVTQPDRSAQDVAKDAQQYYGELPAFEPDGKLGFSVPTVQSMVATKIDADTAHQDIVDIKKILAEEQKKTETLSADLEATKKTLATANSTAQEAKKVAVKSKWAKVGDGLLKVGAIAAIIYGVTK